MRRTWKAWVVVIPVLVCVVIGGVGVVATIFSRKLVNWSKSNG